ncbi:alpha-amylase [candidate division KSB1 bacterium]|nr:alpha-amylase [candidate division KSB1 bacterium]
MLHATEPTFEFHISRQSRDVYQFDQTLFSKSGNVIFDNLYASRIFAQKMNQRRDLLNMPEQAVRASEIYAMGLIDEILHFIIGLYREQQNSMAIKEAMKWLETHVGEKPLDQALEMFTGIFPPLSVYKGETDARTWLKGKSGDVSHREVALEELLMLWIANINPAFSPYLELFNDSDLEKKSRYVEIMQLLSDFFDQQPTFGPDDETLVEMLKSPAIAHPHSLFEQLEYIRRKWGGLLGKYFYRLLTGLDFIQEENKISLPGAGPARVYEYEGLEVEAERFSRDSDWMPRVVMLAKNVYVWLDQLAKKYSRSVNRLDQIPDEELDEIAERGFTVLWLIGLWERSQASKRIKQMCGNPDAEASAYSLYDYQIAADLGGEEAFQNLSKRAWNRGIRMSGDMVPNHMGVDSRWVIENPDYFLSLPHSPYPSYTFNGPNLSENDRVGIYLEDHYYSRSDAAVVFKRVDFHSNDVRYIYHGNDGTSMPWNDTAQLNYLKAEVREAVIQVILSVARKFPVIRFDAAMTLAKKHIKRLWFPEPGTGGAIPSRSEHGLDKEAFDAAMPAEFWREVVDRVAQEAPETLLLAEAFWLLEGYFVRTLGMHRVYNSAFMNMLKNEENANYRSVIKNTIQFDPEILKRYVNFMNNPDEETAVAQFGKDDKYFGVCIMLATMPGLPMFGHGQIEGFTEKYGMEFRRAYWDEQPDQQLIARHKREIFPLLRKRYLFADVEHFLLYDVMTPEEYVNEDVFAYSNRYNGECGLIIYNNRFSHARGVIKESVGFAAKSGNDDEKKIVRSNLGQGLNLRYEQNWFCIFRDHIAGLEYIRNNKDLCDYGLYFELKAFKYHVFLDFRQVEDNAFHHYRDLCAYLEGRGVPGIEEAVREIFLQPVQTPFSELANPEFYKNMLDARLTKNKDEIDKKVLDDLQTKITVLLDALKQFNTSETDIGILSQEIRHRFAAMLQLNVLEHRSQELKDADLESVFKPEIFKRDALSPYIVLNWLLVGRLGNLVRESDFETRSKSWIDEYFFGKRIHSALHDTGFSNEKSDQAILWIQILTEHQQWFNIEPEAVQKAYHVLKSLLNDLQVHIVMKINRHRGVLWFHKESFEQLLEWLTIIAVIDIMALKDKAEIGRKLTVLKHIMEKLYAALSRSDYQVDHLLEATKE